MPEATAPRRATDHGGHVARWISGSLAGNWREHRTLAARERRGSLPSETFALEPLLALAGP